MDVKMSIKGTECTNVAEQFLFTHKNIVCLMFKSFTYNHVYVKYKFVYFLKKFIRIDVIVHFRLQT